MHLNATRNEYAAALGPLLDQTTKAVLAAIAVSLLTTGGEHLDEAQERLLKEWGTLHANGIVPQKPPTPEAVQKWNAQAAETDRKYGLR